MCFGPWGVSCFDPNPNPCVFRAAVGRLGLQPNAVDDFLDRNRASLPFPTNVRKNTPEHTEHTTNDELSASAKNKRNQVPGRGVSFGTLGFLLYFLVFVRSTSQSLYAKLQRKAEIGKIRADFPYFSPRQTFHHSYCSTRRTLSLIDGLLSAHHDSDVSLPRVHFRSSSMYLISRVRSFLASLADDTVTTFASCF